MAYLLKSEKDESLIEESFEGEIDLLGKVVDSLDRMFPKVLFNIEFENGNINKWIITVGDFDFYMKNEKYRKWINVLHQKYSKLKFFTVYKNIDKI